MTTLTVLLEDSLLKRTQQIAEARHTTVDDVVADALKEVANPGIQQDDLDESYEARRRRLKALMVQYSGFDIGGPYTRDELNER